MTLQESLVMSDRVMNKFLDKGEKVGNRILRAILHASVVTFVGRSDLSPTS